MEYIASQGGAPYVLPLVATYGDDRAVYVILPFCPNGDLFGVVEQNGALQEATAATYMGQLVRGLERLHAMGLMDHDISLENTMVDAESRAIIIDFGMAVKAVPTATDFFDGHHAGGSYHAVPLAERPRWPGRCGKPMYMSPELWYRFLRRLRRGRVGAGGHALHALDGRAPVGANVGPRRAASTT